MRVSVVICTVNRAESLARTLDALKLQVYPDFEVVVVAGPSTDGTDELLAARADDLRVVRNEQIHLSISRNLGIDAAAGEIVAFVDDDGIPDPGWLAAIVRALQDPALAGAGGFVRSPHGTPFQYRYSVCSRLGFATSSYGPPAGDVVQRGADPFLYLQGTNACFRRDALVEVGGFDEEIEFFHDETDLCARLIDAGYGLRVLEDADVIHRFEPSHVRDEAGRVTDPFTIVKNQTYFAHNFARGAAREELESQVEAFAQMWRDLARAALERGIIGPEDVEHADRRIAEGLFAGAAAAARGSRRTRAIEPAETDRFRAYPRVPTPPEGRRRVAFISSEYPPADFGGIGRFTQDLAGAFAARGWEAHVIVPGADVDLGIPDPPFEVPTVLEFEDSVWVHRVPPRRRAPRLAGLPVQEPFDRAAAAHHTLDEIEARFGPVDVVSAPLWSADGIVAAADGRWPVVTTLMTSLKTVVDMHPSWPPTDIARLLTLEGETLRRSEHLHAISGAILDSIRRDYPRETAHAAADVLHLGSQDRRAAYPRRRGADGRVRILFVGRLERRKGVDVLLQAAASVLRRHPEAELVLVGKETHNTELGVTYREDFQTRLAAEPELLERVTFAGAVSEDELYAAYADADVFVAPSRYESFGLVHLEAMMMGLPVIGCATGGMVEVVADGQTGLLVPPGDAGALEGALERLVADGEQRRAMGAAARERYTGHFTNALAAERTALAYARIADGHRPEARDVARSIALAIEVTASVAAHVASDIAAGLVDPHGDTPLAAIRRAWHAPDDVFVDELYHRLLLREPDPAGREQFLDALRAGRPRAEIVRDIGWSPERTGQGLDTTFLGELLGLDGWHEEQACASAFGQASDGRFVQDIVDLLVADPAQREPARERVSAALAAGAGRLGAALDLLQTPIPLRHAPDFAGWAPMLSSLGHGATPPSWPGAQRPSYDRGMANLQRAKRLRQVPARAKQALKSIEETRWRTAAMAEALGRMEAQLRDAEQRMVDADRKHELLRKLIALGHESTGKTHENFWHIMSQHGMFLKDIHGYLPFLDAIENHNNERADTINQRITILAGKQEGMAIDLRDRLPTHPLPEDLPEPSIPDEAAYRERVAQFGDDGIKINVGCGEKPLDGYINVDRRPLGGVEVVADVHRMPFEDGSLAELASAHLVEHFRQHHLEVALLPYWRTLLADDGVLRIITPNWEAMTNRLQSGEMSWDEYKLLTFGLQDYDGDDHFALYTPASLTRVLENAGFGDVEIVVEDRMNGLAPEMELTARPARDPQDADAPTAAGARS